MPLAVQNDQTPKINKKGGSAESEKIYIINKKESKKTFCVPKANRHVKL